mgnify:CR=1 FL=1
MKFTPSLRAALLATGLTAIGGVANAAGTAPGTVIGNSIDLSYSSGGNTIERQNAASIDFVVDRKVDFILESQVADKVAPVEQGSDSEYLVFYLENEGNDTSGYDIDVATTPSGLTLTLNDDATLEPGEYEVFIGTDPAPGHAGDTAYDPTGMVNIGDLAADAARYVKIQANIPDNAEDGTSDLFTVTATALDPNSTTPTQADTGKGLDEVDTVLADAGADGKEADSSSYVVQAPVLTGQKTARVISENLDGTFNCATGLPQSGELAAVPGACVEYTITVTNATGASVAASDLHVDDVLPSAVSYVDHDEGDFTTVAYDSSTQTVSADLASLASGASASFTIRVEID